MIKVMGTVFFIRHGDVANPGGLVYGRDRDVRLSQSGRRTISNLGRIILQRDCPMCIYASPSLRTRQTADILSNIWNTCDVRIRKGLSEVWSRGLSGRPIEEIRSFGDTYRNDRMDYQIERPEEIVARMRLVYEEAVGGSRVCAIVSHGDPLGFLLDSIVNSPDNPRPITEIRKDLFLKKGQAWKLVIRQGRVIEQLRIDASGNGRSPDGNPR